MNYLEKISKIDHVITKDLKQRYPCTWHLCFDFVEYALLYKESNRAVEAKNAFRSNLTGTRKLTDLKFLAKIVFYTLLKPRKKSPEDSLLISFSLFHRFPRLTEKIIKNYNCVMLATRTNAKFAMQTPIEAYLKVDEVMYSSEVEIGLGELVPILRAHVLEFTTLDLEKNRELLTRLENGLVQIVDRLSLILRENNVTQYICPYCNRYEEILICLACKKLGIPSKEICHGVNSHKLVNSDNVVPTHADVLYVWNRQFYDNISGFEDHSRIKIGGYPKFDAGQMNEFKKKYRQKKLITYLSQATYDVGGRTDEPVTPEFVAKELAWRKEVFTVLNQLKEKFGYAVRIRYHQGEKGNNPYCDRAAERAQLEAQGFEFSTGPLEQDIFESEVCLGINTSALYEVYVMGQNVYQVYFEAAGADNYHNVIPVIKIEEIENGVTKTKTKTAAPKLDQLFNLESFLVVGVEPVTKARN